MTGSRRSKDHACMARVLPSMGFWEQASRLRGSRMQDDEPRPCPGPVAP